MCFSYVCFSDESTFEILGNKAQFVRCRKGEKFKSDCVVQTVKYPTKVMIWYVIRSKGTGRGERHDEARPIKESPAEPVAAASNRMVPK